MRVGVIDCGTNSIRLLIADIEGTNFREVTRQMQVVRLGQGVDETNQFHTDATTQAEENKTEIANNIPVGLPWYNRLIASITETGAN